MLTVEDHTSQPTHTEPIWSLGALMTLKARSPELEVVEALLGPGVSPPMHRHDFGSESFYVIEGRMRVLVGDSEVTIGPGEIAQIPASTPHSFLTLEHTRVLDIIAPAGLWDFFVECGRPAPELRAPDGPEVPGNLAQIVDRYRGRVLGPPPAWS
jgi:quercetin dioxygenase-like cupin family protein